MPNSKFKLHPTCKSYSTCTVLSGQRLFHMFDGLLNPFLINAPLFQLVPFLGAFNFPESQPLPFLNNFSICSDFMLCSHFTSQFFFFFQYNAFFLFYNNSKMYRKYVAQFDGKKHMLGRRKLINKINMNSKENIFQLKRSWISRKF